MNEKEIYDKGHKQGWNDALKTVMGKVKKDMVELPIYHTHSCPSCSINYGHRDKDCPQINATMRVCDNCRADNSGKNGVTLK